MARSNRRCAISLHEVSKWTRAEPLLGRLLRGGGRRKGGHKRGGESGG